MTSHNADRLADPRDCFESIKRHLADQPSALATAVIATCDAGIAALAKQQATPEADQELPGMWERADFTGGATDAHQKANVPEGMRLVPIEPTDAMRDAGLEAYLQKGLMDDIYIAMLSAAPQSPPSQVPAAQSDGDWRLVAAQFMRDEAASARQYARMFPPTAPTAEDAFERVAAKLEMLSAASPYGLDCAAPSPQEPAVAQAETTAEQFIQAAIANSPQPLKDLGEHLARWLDEDRWATAERLLLQIATTPPQVIDKVDAERWRYLQAGKHHANSSAFGIPFIAFEFATKQESVAWWKAVQEKRSLNEAMDAARAAIAATGEGQKP